MVRRAKDRLDIKRPFAVFIEPAGDVAGVWVAHVVGHDLDNVTQGVGPHDAVIMVHDMLMLMSDRCTSADDGVHDYAEECMLHPEHAPLTPAWRCTKCKATVAKDAVEDVP